MTYKKSDVRFNRVMPGYYSVQFQSIEIAIISDNGKIGHGRYWKITKEFKTALDLNWQSTKTYSEMRKVVFRVLDEHTGRTPWHI